MLKISFTFAVVVAAGCIFFAHHSAAGPLTSAEVTKIINRVSVIDPAMGGHPAAIREVIKDNLGLQTGEKSRSELLFQDNTLTRIGAETFFSFKTGTRDMTLEKGSMLLQVPKGLGGAKIHTAAVTAAITGTTIMIEYIPDQYIKVLVLEGSLRLSRNGTFGDSLVLHPGKMVIMRPDAKKIPDPIDVDLEQIVKTSNLVNFPDDKTPLPSMALIQTAINEQAKQLAKSDLVPTNLVIGSGTKVIVASTDQLTKIVGPLGLLGVTGNGGLIGSVKSDVAALPIVGPTMSNTLASTATTVNNLLGSTSGAVSNLLGGNSSGAAVSVSSSTQLLSFLSNATSSSSGTITVAPALTNVTANAAAIAPSASVNSNAVSATIPLTSNSSLSSIASIVPTLNAQSAIGGNPALVTIGAPPVTGTTAPTFSLGPGH